MTEKRRMTVAVLFSTIVIGGLNAGVSGQPKQEPVKAAANRLSKVDDEAVSNIVAGCEDAWNTHDMKALARLFREDAEWVNKVGMHWRGRDEIMFAHNAFHQTIFKNHKYRTDDVEARSIAPGVAIAVVTETFDGFTAPDGRVWPKARNRISYVLVNGPEGWKIAHGQNTEVDEKAANHDPVQNHRE